MKRRTFKRALRVGSGAFVAAAACATVGAGLLDEGGASLPPAVPVMLAASVIVLLLASISARLRFVAPSA